MTENINNEISNLFEELIVSKIKNEINRLDQKLNGIVDSNEIISDRLENCPKNSAIDSVGLEVKEAKDNILKSLENLEKDTGKYLKGIVDYLKKQYQFPERKKLCEYLENVLNELNEKLENVSDDECIKICKEIAASSINQFEEEMCKITEIISELQNINNQIKISDEKITTDISRNAEKLLSTTRENEKKLENYYNQVVLIKNDETAIQNTMTENQNTLVSIEVLVKDYLEKNVDGNIEWKNK